MEIKLSEKNGLSDVEISTSELVTTLNYNQRPLYSDLTTILDVKTDKNLLFYNTCGCTIATPQKTENGYILSVKYDAEKVGVFGKTVIVTDYVNNKEVHQIILRGLIK